jgi:TM2 domain-containing membrane protein YozV
MIGLQAKFSASVQWLKIKKTSPKSRGIALILAIFALHRPYVGRLGTGLIQFLLSLLLIGYIWVLYDVGCLIKGTFKDGKGRVLGAAKPETIESGEAEQANDPPVETKTTAIAEDESDENSFFIPLDFEKLAQESFGYQWFLDCIVVYYGDGRISEKELDYLLKAGDWIVRKDIPDRELEKRQMLVQMLDQLKDGFE